MTSEPTPEPRLTYIQKCCREFLGIFYDENDLISSFAQKLVYRLFFGGVILAFLWRMFVKLFKKYGGYDECEKCIRKSAKRRKGQ